MTEIIFAHGGTLDKYIGDGLMALFGAPTATPEDARNAVNAAVAMQKRHCRPSTPELVALGLFQDRRRHRAAYRRGDHRLHRFRTAIRVYGDRRHGKYGVAASNRMPAADRYLISEATAQAAGDIFPMTKREPLVVKNRLQPVELFEVKWE